MKIFYASMLILIYSVIVQGQIQSVIGNSGGEYKAAGFTVEYTLGESIIPTLSNNRLVLTQGVDQNCEVGPSFLLYFNKCHDNSSCIITEVPSR